MFLLLFLLLSLSLSFPSPLSLSRPYSPLADCVPSSASALRSLLSPPRPLPSSLPEGWSTRVYVAPCVIAFRCVAQAQKACRAPPFSSLRKFLAVNGRYLALIVALSSKDFIMRDLSQNLNNYVLHFSLAFIFFYYFISHFVTL